MAPNQRSQKQVAEKYKGNLDYFKKPHYLRRLRTWSFLIVAVLSVVAVLTFRYWGTEEFLSSGPISKSHAAFAHDCRVCHLGAQTDLLETSPLAETSRALGHMSVHGEPANGAVTGAINKGMASTALAFMDEACLKCHPGQRLHQPQSASLALRTAASELSVVHATGCAVCHREHLGRRRMALPDSQTCVSCHNDPEALNRTRQLLKLDSPTLAASGENRALAADGLVRFIAPARPAGTLPSFASYAEGHPPFAYEAPQLRDPAALQFNHARHERDDIPLVGNRKLACADCHQPTSDGAFYQPVRYAAHCQQCHSLQIQPTLPQLQIPHGDAQKVRYFLASLQSSFEGAIRAEGVSEPTEISRRAETEMESVRRRGLRTLADLEETVFFLGDPPGVPADDSAGKGMRKFLTECAKCHVVRPATDDRAPEITPPMLADRWVQRGPFTHLPHAHMSCADCHGAVSKSKLTSDILLPPQKLCAECHRAPVAGVHRLEALKPNAAPSSRALVAAQRSHGGVRWDCQSCHSYHGTSDTRLLETITAPPQTSSSGAADQASSRKTR